MKPRRGRLRLRYNMPMGEARYNIGQLAKAAGVAATTVRFYERKGLILPVGRTLSNYRWYDDRSLARLRLIRQAHAGGFSLGDIRCVSETVCVL